jgi:DsbC/DsbD-like thiol-disulfide interchange protein
VISDLAAAAYDRVMLKQGLIIFFLTATLIPGPGHATTQEEVVQARFLQGWETDRGSLMMGIRLTLSPGWKTYWRSPGDSGIPPAFDWTGSENLGEVRIHWPRPAVFLTNGMTSIGYHDGLVLPVEIFPARSGQDVTVALQLDLGVCDEICLPASLGIAGLAAPDGRDSADIKAALAARPTSGKSAGLNGIQCEIAPIDDGLRVTARLDMPPIGAQETVIFEAGLPGVWVSHAQSQRSGNLLTATVDMVGQSGAPFALDRSGVTLTIVAGNSAVELQGCPSGD